MIFMLFSIMWGRIKEHTTNFEHLVHETWPRTCGRVVFKFYKKQTKSENHETCQDVMISYVEAVIKIWEFSRKLSRTMLANRRISEEVSWFREETHEVVSIVYDKLARNLLNFLSQPPHMISWHLVKFQDFSVFICFLYNLKTTRPQVWSCFMNKMFEIGGLFLDTASHYTK